MPTNPMIAQAIESGEDTTGLCTIDEGRISSVPHPPWATHAMGGFNTSDECIDHAEENSPGKNYGITFQIRCDGKFTWQWFYPEYEHQKSRG